MKKILTIALVAILAASTTFAAFSGKATLGLGYNTESKAYGFSNGSEFSVDIDVASAEAGSVGEGDIYTGVKATLALKLADLASDVEDKKLAIYVKDDVTDLGLGVLLSLEEAYVAGKDWKVAITETPDEVDFAASAIDTKKVTIKDAFGNDYSGDYYWEKTKKAVTYAVSVNAAPGVTATVKDWTVGLGFNGSAAEGDKYFNYHASLFTPSFALADGLTIKAAAVASGAKDSDADEKFDAFGASAEVAYASDDFSGKVAADFGMKKGVEEGDKFVPGLDVAANVVVSAFTVDGYYKYEEKAHFLSAQVKADLSAYDVPVSVKVYGKEVTNKTSGQSYGAEVKTTLDAFAVTVGGSYKFSKKSYGLSGAVEYTAEKFTAKAGVNFSKTVDDKDSAKLYANASIESDVLVPGATLKLAYAPNLDDSDGSATSNLLKKSGDYGYVKASCTIAF